MKRSHIFVVFASLLVLCCMSLQTSVGQDDDAKSDGRPVGDIRMFMRGKLQASNKILEGLTVEDMQMVKEGAQQLNKMSVSEKWRAHNNVMYKQFSGEFQRTTADLMKAADEGNLDMAALKWMSATMSCIECHRYVRNNLVVETKAN